MTSASRAIATARLRAADLPRPTVLVCAEDVAAGKPSPEGYLVAAARLGVVAASCIVVEDAATGIESAHAAGMHSIAVTTTHSESELEAADVVINDLTELPSAISVSYTHLTLPTNREV